MQADMSHMPHIPPDATADQARALLAAAGWREVGTGNWSWAFADPEDRLAARVTPFDPAYRLHAQACLDGPANRWLPRVDAILPLLRDGYVTVMERLYPAPEADAHAFCTALGIVNESGYELPHVDGFDQADADLELLRERIRALMATGAQRFKLWGGSDIRPGNLMADAGGRLKVVDPIFIRGPLILEGIAEGRRDMLTDFSREQLEDFLTIPVFEPGPETDELRRKLAALLGPISPPPPA